MTSSFLMSYFRTEREEDGEQIRFAVSEPGDPTTWRALSDGAPALRSDVGERGVRDPFLVRHPRTGRIFLIATDLRVATDGDWDRAVRRGSRSIVVWWTDDLRTWTGPQLVEVSDERAGNTWAPKAFWSAERDAFLVIWASALYDGSDHAEDQHQRLVAATTDDFVSFSAPQIYFDPGHDVIDATFLAHDDSWYRFSANAQSPENNGDIGHHVFMEVGDGLEDPAFRPLRVDVGTPELERGEGPAVFSDPQHGRWYLLIDEFDLRGYQLFRTTDLASGEWEHVPSARLPDGARHGSVLEITAEERAALEETP